MGGILGAITNSAAALSVYQKEFGAIQNNIANANTPGYSDQSLALAAQPFDLATGASGGVMTAGMINSRSEYLEQNVRNQQTLLGASQQNASDLGQVQPLFDPNSTDGIASSLSNFFNSFSALSVNPNNAASQQAVLAAASQIARSFNATASGIQQVASGIANQTTNAVGQINQLAARIAGLNQQIQQNASAAQDPAVDSAMHSDLETLSGLANFSLVKSSDGTYNVFLGGQSPLVLGSQQYAISAAFPPGQTQILDSQGKDVTSQITGGSLGGMLTESNSTLPGYLSQVNTVAQTFADQVNGQLAQGVDQSGAAPVNNLFTYDASAGAASTIAVNPSITPDQIAAGSAGSPGGNGNAIAVAGLANQPLVSGLTFTQAFADLNTQVGSDVANAQQTQTEDQALVTQAQQQRQLSSGVDLNTEAAKLLQFQQSYQAVGQMVTVLNSMTQTLMGILPLGSSA